LLTDGRQKRGVAVRVPRPIDREEIWELKEKCEEGNWQDEEDHQDRD
jgi:hypothetical protein